MQQHNTANYTLISNLTRLILASVYVCRV